MEETVYKSLAAHLDRLASGFAPSSTGAELKLLRRLFTPEEAALAALLSLAREGTAAIAERAGLPVAEVEHRLKEMARKGLVFDVPGEDGCTSYQAAPWLIGIYEFQVNRMSAGFLQDLDEYYRTREARPQSPTIPQRRIVPVARSIEARSETLPYERVYELVREHTKHAVGHCMCRRKARIAGRGCDAPEESCLWFGDFADYYVRYGLGRAIDRAEVMEILTRADASGLVLQATNSRQAASICCCCACCCGGVAGLKASSRPAEAAASPFVAALRADSCTACWTCIGRCPMGALAENGDRVALNADRCIGCGLCVSTCPSGSLSLIRVPGREPSVMPDTFFDTWREISSARARALEANR